MAIRRKWTIGAAVVACLLLCPPTAAFATGMALLTTEPKITTDDAGKHTATLTILNTTDAPGTISATVTGQRDGCTIDAKDGKDEIAESTATEITLTFTPECQVDKGVPTTLTVTNSAPGATPTKISAKIAAPEAKASIAPRIIATVQVAIITTGLLLGGLLIGHNLLLKKDLKADTKPTWVAGGLAGAKSIAGVKSEPLDVSLLAPLKHLGTDWSFKDSWIANTTIGATALIALFAASDVLTTIFGSEQKNAIAFMAVTSALATVLVSLGPLLIKVITSDPEVPMALGLYIAGLVVVLGSMVQLWGATIQVTMLVETNWLNQPATDQPPQWSEFYLVGIAISLVVLVYAWRSLLSFVEKGTTPPKEEESETLEAAEIIASALSRSNGEPTDLDDLEKVRRDGGAPPGTMGAPNRAAVARASSRSRRSFGL